MPDDNAQTTKRSRLRKILRTITGRKAAQQIDAQALRHTMVEDLIERNILHSEGLKSALRKVPRHEFIPHVTPAEAYRNYPIDTQRHGSVTTSCAPQPEVMTLMLEQLDPQPGHRILEIGAGTGYNAAIMSSITGDQGHVTSVDIEADITANARRALDENGYGAVNCQQADGWNGYPPDAPYDRIMSTVGVTEIPTAWLEQTTEDAIIVTPIQVRGFTMGAALQKRGHDLVSNSICHCTPLPIRGTRKTVIGHHTVGNSPSGPVQMTIAVDEGADTAAKDAADLLQEEMWLRQTEHPTEQILHTTNMWSGFYMACAGDPRLFMVRSPDQDTAPHATGYGLADPDSRSAAIIWDDRPGHLAVYGNEVACNLMLEHIENWLEAQMPTIADLRIRVLPSPPAATEPRQWIVTRQSGQCWVMWTEA